jgi:glycosidase
MTNLNPKSVEQFRDSFGVRFYDSLLRNRGVSHEEALRLSAEFICRDGCRTPMQWDTSANAGFSTTSGRTWLPINENYQEGINVADQQRTDGSTLSFVRKLIELRRQHEALSIGRMDVVPGTGDVFSFVRATNRHRVLVALNMSESEQLLQLGLKNAEIMFRTRKTDATMTADTNLLLEPYGVVLATVTAVHGESPLASSDSSA